MTDKPHDRLAEIKRQAIEQYDDSAFYPAQWIDVEWLIAEVERLREHDLDTFHKNLFSWRRMVADNKRMREALELILRDPSHFAHSYAREALGKE